MQHLQRGVARLRLVDTCHSVHVAGSMRDVAACLHHQEQPDECHCALQAWRAAHSDLFRVADESIYRCVEQLAAAHRSAVAELRLALLVYVVDRHLRFIKERLWRPEGRLVQRREAALHALHESAAQEAAERPCIDTLE